MILDVTDLQIEKPNFPPELKDSSLKEKWDWLRTWYSHKFNKYGIKYEIGIHVITGKIVWVHGPFRGGVHDLNIFRDKLIGLLSPGEMILADKGYVGSISIITPTKGAPYSIFKRCSEDKVLNAVRSKVEMIIGRIKFFNCCKVIYRSDLEEHKVMFDVVCRLTNLMLKFEPFKSKEEDVTKGYQ